jgi:hypothetical protein
MQSGTEFLTPEECAEVDQALLTSHDKFTARVTIYALRSLKSMAKEHHLAINALQPEQIEDWIYQDSTLQQGIDQEFRKFFSQLVISSLKPLKQMALHLGTDVENLEVPQLITWFEAEAKARIQQKH